MAGKTATKETKVKAKARPVTIGTIMMVNAYEKNFSTGSTGFFGQGMDSSGVKYTITAVKNGSKPAKTVKAG